MMRQVNGITIPGGNYVEYKGYWGLPGNDLKCRFNSQDEIEAYCNRNDSCMGYSYNKLKEEWWCAKTSADKGDPTDAEHSWFENSIRTRTTLTQEECLEQIKPLTDGKCVCPCAGKDKGCKNILEGDGDCDRDSDCVLSFFKCGVDNCQQRGSSFF